MEVYCGYQENADWNVGRLLDAARRWATWTTR
jgi:arylsulfatase A-like enzyme